jgi:thiol-disulfide isomerase/thioredoxin
METKTIVTEFESRHQFLDFLKSNPGFVVVKLGAEWCGPCTKIHNEVNDFFSRCPENVICCDIDVDDSFDLYAFLKSKKMVTGIPVIMVWKQGSVEYIPDYSYVGADKEGLANFVNMMLNIFGK